MLHVFKNDGERCSPLRKVDVAEHIVLHVFKNDGERCSPPHKVNVAEHIVLHVFKEAFIDEEDQDYLYFRT